MADRRLFNQVVLMSDEFLFELSEQAKNLYLAIGLSTDDYGFVKNYKRLIDETKVGTENVQELINHKFIYLIDRDTLVDLKFQINNNLAPSKTNEPRYPQGLKHVYMDIDCQYCWSSTKIRDVFGYSKGGNGKLSRKDLFIDSEDEKNQHIKAVDTTQQKASDFLGATLAKEVKQTPSIENTASVQPEAKEVAPAPTKQANKVQDELKRLDDEQVNPFITTEKGQQQREALDQEYKPDQQQDITQDDIENLVAGAQTRSMDTQEPQPHYKDVGLTAEQQRELRDNPPEEDTSLPFDEDEDDTQAELNREAQDTQPIGYSPIDTSDLPFPD